MGWELYFVAATAVVALIFASILAKRITAADAGDELMQSIALSIQEGASSFLKREYTVLAGFVAIVAAILLIFIDLDVAGKYEGTYQLARLDSFPAFSISYILGAFCSALTGYIGMKIAVRANVRTAALAREGLNKSLNLAFSSGTVMGMSVVGISLLGIILMYGTFRSVEVLAAFAFGASSIALFARVGGGIFTKAADVGADLVGKVEAGIPEDDPRNPATIADNVGDNVGDVAGMGADLFESYSGSIIAAMSLVIVSTLTWEGRPDYRIIGYYPLLIMGIGIISSIIGTFLVRTKEDADMGTLLWALRKGIFGSGLFVIIGAWILTNQLNLDMNLLWVVVVGLVAGNIIGLATEYYTAYEYKPTKNLSAQAEAGAGPLIIGGLSVGMLSTVIPILTLCGAIAITYNLAGLYGIALAAVGMLSTLGITLASDAYGPVADNAGGIAEQAGLPAEVRERTDALDSLGNTTAATGKGFAIGSAVLTSLALMATYTQTTGISSVDLLNYKVLIGLLIGSLMPFVFSALTMGAVGKAAMEMVEEVRRQFREMPGIMKGTEKPDSNRAVDIATKGALKEMMVPGIIAIATPIIVGVVLKAEALGGLLIGSIGSGALLALMMANAGGAWDNAKKYIEMGNSGGKGSDAHKAAVVGDTVGDPFKDTSGPSINILLKLMAIVAVVFGPLFLS
jgi:K(+)-stimulated pyrophosphate-energized sodium pump